MESQNVVGPRRRGEDMHVHKDCMRHSSRSVITLFIGQSVQIKKALTGRHIDKEERNLPSSAVNST